jgi:hypothetical protein
VSSGSSNLRNTHWKYALPWEKNGLGILPALMFPEYSAAMRKAIQRFMEAADAFVKIYPDIVANAHKRLVGLIDGKDFSTLFPSEETVRSKFRCYTEIYPFPYKTDFRTQLADDGAEDIRQQAEANVNSKIKEAVIDTWYRLGKLLNKMSEALKDTDRVFHDSLINNIKEFVYLLPKFNFANDAELTAMEQELQAKICSISPDDIRGDRNVRSEAQRRAEEIFKKVQSYI